MKNKIIAFDLDGTLADSKQPITTEMADFLTNLAKDYEIAIITGGTLEQIESQVMKYIPSSMHYKFHLMGCSGAIYKYLNVIIYKMDIPYSDRLTIYETIENIARKLKLWEDSPSGEIIEDRQVQITFSALGQKASLEDKLAWDPTGKKRKKLRNAVQKALPNYDVRSGGSTSIDISQQGMSKEYGIKQLMKYAEVDKSELLYVGDKFAKGENDYPVLATGVKCLTVASPHDTMVSVRKII